MENEVYDCQYSILLVGNSGAGKTSLLTKYVHDKFSTTFNPTIGIDFKIKSLRINDKKIKLRIWDTAGQEKFRTITSSYYKGAQGVVVCFAVDNRESFHGSKNWLTQVKQLANSKVISILVGCKSDIHPREVSIEEAERFAAEYDIKYVEISSLDGTNIDSTFQDLLEAMHNRATNATPVLLASANQDDDSEKHSTIERNKFLQSAYEVQISGAQSWYNKNKINGRYVPQITKDGQILLELGRFCYWNIDSPDTVMIYKDSHWLIKKNRKELAKVASSSIQCFPDTASLRNVWCENFGVYFTWMHPQPNIKCVVLHAGRESSRISVADIFTTADRTGTINMSMFLQYSREPEQMGLTIPQFVKCCQIRVAILDLEFRKLKKSFDYVSMAEVRIQRQQIDKACKALMATVSLPEQPRIHVTKDSVVAALSGFLQELEEHYEKLCDLETGNFDAARRCRDTQQDLVTALDKLTAFVPAPDPSRMSMLMMENGDLSDLDLENMQVRLTEGGTMIPDQYFGVPPAIPTNTTSVSGANHGEEVGGGDEDGGSTGEAAQKTEILVAEQA